MIRVKASVLRTTAPTPADDDDAYFRWHLLDHQPEQFQLPGIQWSHRWTADSACVDARIACEGPQGDVGNVVNYLIGDPVQQTYDNFMELGGRLAERGRFPIRRPNLELRLLALLQWYAAPRALISPEVVPFRPHRGVALIVEEPADGDLAAWQQWLHTDHYPAVLETPGVAGAWMYATTGTWKLHRLSEGARRVASVIYLDDDPLAATKAFAPLIEQRWASGAVRPIFAGPLRTMIHWDAWPEGS